MGRAWALACITAVAGTAAITGPASATLTQFLGNGNLAAFNAAAGNPPVTIDFDSIPTGTNISTLNGVTFTSPTSNPLTVVDASTTTSFCCGPTVILVATSGANVLSPGGAALVAGPDPAQRDSLQLDFQAPLAAFGIDVLFQSLDGVSLTTFTVYGADKTTVLLQDIPLNIPALNVGGGFFMGLVSDDPTTHIGRIVITETDDNDINPDSNIGYDTLRFVPFPAAVAAPEPASLAILGMGLAAFGLTRRRRP